MKTLPLRTLLLALLLGIAPATAAEVVFEEGGGILDAEGVEAVLPTVDSPLTLVYSAVPSGGEVSPEFTLTAQRLRVEVDRSDLAVRATGYQRDPYTVHTDHENATVLGTDNFPSGELYVVPLAGHEVPHLDLDTGCLDLRAADERDTDRFPPYVNGSREPVEVDLEDKVRLRTCNYALGVLVTGSFQVRLWSWDARIQDARGERNLQTGYYDNQIRATQSVADAYLTVHNGTFRIPAIDDSVRIYANHTSVASDLVRFDSPTGSHGTGAQAHPDGDDLILRGGVWFDAHAERGRIVASFFEPDTEDEASLLATLAVPVPGAPWMLPAVLLVALAVGAAGIHRRRAPLRALDLFWTNHELDLSVAPRTPRERRALGMQLLGARFSVDGDVERGQRLQARAASLYECPIEALLGLGETLLAIGAYEHALDVLFSVQESQEATATQRVRAQLGAAAAHMRRNAPADRHVCVEYLRDADAHDPSTVRRLLERAGSLGAELRKVLPKTRSGPGEAMFG